MVNLGGMAKDRDEETGTDSGDLDGRAAATRGETFEDLTGGLSAESVPALRSVRDLSAVYPLLHALVGSSPTDYLVRAAALESLVGFETGSFTARDLDECLYWLDPERRPAVLKALRRSGWLAWDSSQGTTITTEGRWVYDILSFLHRRLKENELLPTLAGVEYALEIGLDPIRHLRSMRSRLVALREQMYRARESHSEVVLRLSVDRLAETLDLSRQVRAVLERIPVENAASRAVARDIHDLLSLLHGMSADLQSAIAEVGRQFLRLTAGLTVEQIVRALMETEKKELARVGRESLLPVVPPPPLLTTEVLAAAAEQQFLREREEAEPVVWEEPPEAPRRAEASEILPEVAAFLSDLAGIEEEGRTVPLAEMVPHGDEGESFLRASLLPLVGRGTGGEGIAGRLGALALVVDGEGDGWPEPIGEGPLRRLTPGRIGPEGRD